MAIKIDMKDLADLLQQKTDEFVQDFSYEMAARTVEKAPVKTGQLRGSINLSNSASATDSSGVIDKSGSSTKSKLRQQANNLNPKQDAYVTAGTDYAGQVEFGSNGNTPRAYIRGTVNEAQTIAEKTARNIT